MTIAFMLMSVATFAQEWLSFDVKGITIVRDRQNYELQIYSNGEKIARYRNLDGYDLSMLERKLRARIGSYKSTYPNGKVAFHFDYSGDLLVKIKDIDSFVRISSTGNSVRSSDLQARIAELEAQNDELEKKVNLLSGDLENAEKSNHEKNDLLMACVESNRTLELENTDLRSSQEALDIAVNAQGRKRFIKEYNEIKNIISTVKAE